jgi:hypothetical protein
MDQMIELHDCRAMVRVCSPRWVAPHLREEDDKSVIYLVFLIGQPNMPKYVGSMRVGPVGLHEEILCFRERFKGIESLAEIENAKLACEFFSSFPADTLCAEVVALVAADEELFYEDFYIRSFRTVTPFGLNADNVLANAADRYGAVSTKRKAEAAGISVSKESRAKLLHRQHGLELVWSVMGDPDGATLLDPIPHKGIRHVVYDIWGPIRPELFAKAKLKAASPTWLDVWKACNEAYKRFKKKFGPADHTFIEGWTVHGDTLTARLGS